MKKILANALLASLFSFVPAEIALAESEKQESKTEQQVDEKALEAEQAAAIEEFKSQLKFRHGTVELREAGAQLNVPPEFKYLEPESATTVLVDAWGNPPESAEGNLGMIFPASSGPLDENGWGVIVSYEEDGYISDDGAEKIDYQQMLKEMKNELADVNPERVEQGYPSIELVGWAEPPHYDKTSHKIYWAKEMNFGGADSHTLNYNIRVLGRKGVLNLNAVADISQLPDVSKNMQQILQFVEFNNGSRYADYKDGDKVAEYGIAALVTGAVAVKTGLLKGLIAALIAGKKFLILAVLGVVAGIRSLVKRNKTGPAETRP
jgi:uncharacterized membrane-anchored protein